ncbi:hypothetical protein OG625_00240 [Streptomyces sp. NBC_01351]|uniref:hypothetical protein n=1 Tax=Streptomyces sp. NBC_01351 TaxID=2903833 RepID=UPI002E34CF29|nr:hypothetical protein [Streptomyces sp. NBC_01351]
MEQLSAAQIHRIMNLIWGGQPHEAETAALADQFTRTMLKVGYGFTADTPRTRPGTRKPSRYVRFWGDGTKYTVAYLNMPSGRVDFYLDADDSVAREYEDSGYVEYGNQPSKDTNVAVVLRDEKAIEIALHLAINVYIG